MIPIDQIQFAGIVLTILLTAILAFMLPHRQPNCKVLNHTRWLMMAGTILLPIHFLLQYTLHFRLMGVTQAVMINLLFFVPAAYFLNLAVLYLLRQGRVNIYEWLIGVITYLMVLVSLGVGAFIDDQPLLSDTPQLRAAEMTSAVIYLLMQIFYASQSFLELRRLKRALEDYYDQDKSSIFKWMCISISLLLLTGIMAPMAIFWSGPYLIVFSMTIFFTIFYCVLSFYSYGIDHTKQKELIEAEKSAEEARLNNETETMLNESDRLRIEKAIDRWIAKGGHLKPGLNIGHVVNDTHVSRYQFTLWLRTTEWELFSPWLTHLRYKHL